VSIDARLFDSAVAAASFILDEVEEPIYDDNLFVHYTATIIEKMGGRGAGVTSAARRIYQQWAGNHHFELYDEVPGVLEQLAAAGYRLGVISNSHRSLDAFTDHFKLNNLITAAVSSAEHGFMKPHRSIFDAALEQAEVAANEALMVGDSVHADIAGAVAAGMHAVLLRRSGDPPQFVPAGVSIIYSLSELPTLLGARR
jgi:HAD superfamily hydrolase (TIGR01662 family)